MENEPNFYSGKTKTRWACEALLQGRTLSQHTEIREKYGWRLPAIIHRLKHDFGWPIQTEYRKGRVAFYWLPADCDKALLKMPHSVNTANGNAA